MDLSKSWDRFIEKYDSELVNHIRASERGMTEDLSEYESEWIRPDKDLDPERPEAEKNYKGIVKSIKEASKSMSQRSGHRFTEPEIAVRYLDNLKDRVRSRSLNRDARWEEKVWQPSLEKAIFHAEITAIWSDVALKLIEHYNLDERGFENQPDSLALLIGENGLAKKYLNSEGSSRENVKNEIEQETENFVQNIQEFLEEDRNRSKKIIEKGEEELPNACNDIEELKQRYPKLYSIKKNSIKKNKDRSEDAEFFGLT